LRLFNPFKIDPYRWYNTRRWKTRSTRQLREHPLCNICACLGKATRATVADHVVPHHGDWNAFITGELQSLCKPCHDNVKTKNERLGYNPQIGVDGLPLDPNHPVYRHSKRHSTTTKISPSIVPEI
jgi:5-methylcytosine-specific restriction enzyme A